MATAIQPGFNLNEYEPLLRNYAFSLTRNREETEDLIQDTFYRAIANIDKFAEGTNVKAWLLTIMRNIFINNYRKRKRSFTRVEPLDNPAAANSIKKASQNGSTRALLAEDISKALNAVSTSFTEPFLMHYNGFHYDEIAEKMGLPLGTVKSRIFFARKEIQARLQKLGITNSQAA